MSKCVNFALDVMRFLYRETSNIVFSPISLEIAALSILAGLRNTSFDEMSDIIFDTKINNKSINELSNSLRSLIDEVKSQTAVEFKMHNFIYLSNKFKLIEQYMEKVRHSLDTRIKQVNFDDQSLELYNIIDAEVSDATMGRINQVIKNIPTVSNLLLINSTTLQSNANLIFQSDHNSPSCSASTKQFKQLFKSSYEGKHYSTTTNQYDNSMNIDFAAHSGIYNYYRDAEQGFTCVELQYMNSNLNLILILPKEGTSPREILDQLTQYRLLSISKLMSSKQMEIKIPIIKLKMNIDLTYIWQLIGLQKIFNYEESDFSGMVSNPKGLCLEAIIFNCELQLNGNFKDKTVSKSKQSNSKSSKNTQCNNSKSISSNGKKSSLPSSTLSLEFNRPFMYFITCNLVKDQQQQRKIILFAGVVNNLINS